MRLRSASACLALAASWPAASQQAAPTPAPAPALADATAADIIVTARRRAENIQTVPVAITALNAETLTRLKTRDLSDLSGFAPSVVIDGLGGVPGGIAASIRGIGTFEIEKTNEPSVGVMVDGVFLGTNSYGLLNTLDVQSVEILRGPQGVLFGRNTTGGLINLSRTRPERDKLEVRALGRLGSFAQRDASVILLAPLGQYAAVKLSGFLTRDDGFYRNTAQANRRAGGRDILSGLAGVRLFPTDDSSVYVQYERIRDRSEIGVTANVATPGQGVIACDAFRLCLGVGSNDRRLRDVAFNGINSNRADLDAVTIQADAATAIGTITSITGWRTSHEFRGTDADSTVLTILDPFTRIQTERQFSQELRLNSDTLIPRTNLVAGVYYFRQQLTNETQNRGLFPFLGSIGALGPLRPTPDYYTGSNQIQRGYSMAGFASADIEIVDRLRLSLGGRYTIEKKDFSARDSGFGPGRGFGTIGLQVAPGVIIFPFPPGAGFPAAFLQGRREWKQFTPRVGLDWRPTQNLLVYGSWSRGFKSGGFNGRFDTTVPGAAAVPIPAFDPEVVDTYEGGFKATLLERRLLLNGAVFYNKYRDKQEQIILPNPNDGGLTTVTVITNAATVTGKGFELEATARPTDIISLRVGASYNDISYDRFVADIGRPGGRTDNSDLRLVRAPKWTLAGGASFDAPVGPGSANGNVNVRYIDGYFLNVPNDPGGFVRAYALVDAAIGYELPVGGARVSLSVFGRNLTEVTRLNSYFRIGPVATIAGVSPPRRFGVELRVTY